MTIDSVTQRWPWNNKVDITYTVNEGQDVEAGIYCRLVFNASVNGETYVIDGVTNVGASASSGTHTITWNPPSGVKTANCTMTAQLIEADKPSGNDYMVVDIQTGKVWYEGLLKDQAASNERYNTALYKTTNMVFRKIARTCDSACPNGYRTGSSAIVKNTQTNWITYKDYYVGVFPVTQWQYNELWGALPANSKTKCKTDVTDGEGNVTDNHWYRPVDAPQWNHGRYPQDPTQPVSATETSTTFLGRLNWRTLSACGVKGFDYPTKLMAEIASRGGTTTRYIWGDTWSAATAKTYAWFGYNDSSSENYRTCEVGKHLPNALGLYDVFGNVREFVLDDASCANFATLPDPFTPSWGGVENVDRVVANRMSYATGAWSTSGDTCDPASIASEQYNKGWTEYGIRVAFIPE